MVTDSKRHCVILHLYYQYMWDEIKEYLLNLQEVSDFDLFITCTEENIELFEKIYSSFNSNVNIKIDLIENTKGADIYPFFYILNKINLDNYNLVYKIHTKQNFSNKIHRRLPNITNIKFYIGYKLWRIFLLEAILGKNNVIDVINLFNNNPQTGMAGFGPLLVKYRTSQHMEYPYNFDTISSEYKFKQLEEFKYYVGTIFTIRAHLLKCLQNKYTKSDFEIKTDEKFIRLAWIMEAFLGYIVEAQGYKIESIYNDKKIKFIMEFLSHKITLFLYKYYINHYIFKCKLV